LSWAWKKELLASGPMRKVMFWVNIFTVNTEPFSLNALSIWNPARHIGKASDLAQKLLAASLTSFRGDFAKSRKCPRRG
jgi:hypothetical protein